MGNCMETYTVRQQDAPEMQQQQQQEREEIERRSRLVKINNNGGIKNGVRVKVVLTREELKWVILQLNQKAGIRLEHVLEEIERGRAKVIEGGWKPSLESILEVPEMLHEMDR